MIVLIFSSFSFANVDLITTNRQSILKSTFSYLIDSQKFQEAKKLTQNELKNNPQNPEVIHLDGLASYLMSNYLEAEESFLKASKLTQGADRATNLYLLAKTYLKQKKNNEAKSVIVEMNQIEESNSYSRLALEELNKGNDIPEFYPNYSSESLVNSSQANIGKQPSDKGTEKNLIFNANMVYGLDSNPIFIPDFSQEKNDAKSSFYSLSGGITFSSKLVVGKISNNLNFGYTNYSEVIAKSFNNARLSLVTNWNPSNEFLKKNKISFANKLDRSYQAENELNYYFTSDVFSFKKEILSVGVHSLNSSFSLGYRTYANKNLVNKEDDRSGMSYSAKGIYKIALEEWAILNSFGGTDQQTYGNKFDTLALDYTLNIQKVLFYEIEALLGYGVTRIDYVNSETGRVDLMSNYGLDLSRDLHFLTGSTAKLSYSRTKNKSDLEASTYTQDIFSLWINYDF